MIQVLINPDIPPPPPAGAVEVTRQSCRNLKSKITEGGEYNSLVEVSVNSKEENSRLLSGFPPRIPPLLTDGTVTSAAAEMEFRNVHFH
jgi:hypothetical protein